MADPKRPFDLKNERVLFPLAALLLASLVLLPRLGTYGLWDPQEIAIADTARDLAKDADPGPAARTKPPLTTWLIATSIRALGPSELAARLPLALLGIVGVLVTYRLGSFLRRPRAGLLSAVVLASSPLFLFQARQLTSEIPALTAFAITMLGIAQLAWPIGPRNPLRTVGDAALVVAGTIVGYFASGLFLGACIPLLAGGLAAGLAWRRQDTEDAEPAPRSLALATIALGAVGLLGLTIAVVGVFDLVPAQAGHRAIFGKMLASANGYLSVLGGTFKPGPPASSATFDRLINQVAFGMFPWSAIAPMAVLGLVSTAQRRREAFGSIFVACFCLVGYVGSALFVREVSEVRFVAIPAIALAVGMAIDDFFLARTKREGSMVPLGRAGLPLMGLFCALAALQLARDVMEFPEELAAVHLLSSLKVPSEVRGLVQVAAVLGGAAGVLLALGLAVPAGESPIRNRIVEKAWSLAQRGIQAAICLCVVLGLFLASVFTPSLSEHFSYKNLFHSYFDHRQGAEPLAVMGIPGSGPEYYAQGPFKRLASRTQLVEFLKTGERVFAIAPASELCPVHQSSGADRFPYFVLDNRNSRFLLFTNQLGGKEKDENPLSWAIRRTPPEAISRPFQANFEGKIELLGFDMPSVVSKGEKFKLTLYFRVLEKLPMNYKIFLHFDGRGVRFQGDHDPISGRCGTSYWQPGDFIVDTVEVTAGEMTHPRGRYTTYMGFFTGSSGNWKNMVVTSGNGDSNNRVNLGTLEVK